MSAAQPERRSLPPARRCASAAALLCGLCVPLAAAAALPIEHWETSAGARVYFVASHGLPMLDVSVDFAAGSCRDAPDRSGLASLTQRVMRLGAQDMDEDEIARRLADVGANLLASFDLDRAGYALRVLSSDAEQRAALEVLARVLQSPSFPVAVLEREKARVIAGLQEADTRPDSITARAFMQLVFRDHPYALRSAGEPTTVARLTRDDLSAFYHAHYVADRAVVSIVGDATRERAQQIAEQLTRGLARGSAALPELPPVTPLTAATERDIAHPSAQAHILIGQPGLTRTDPDYFALWLGNWVLGGGGLSSRLSEQVRQKRGLSYSVYSSFVPYQQAGPFQIGLQTRGDQAAEALAVVREVLREFLAVGPSERELESAKRNVVDGFALRIDTNRKLLDFVRVIGYYGLPLDYLDTFTAKVDAVSADEIREAFKRRIQPASMATAVVGAKAAR